MGNEASQQVKYGEKLENDIRVTWNKLDSEHPLGAREGHSACACGTKLYAFGGVLQNGEESNDLIIYDTEKGTWHKAGVSDPWPSPRSAATLACVGNKLFLFGGLSHQGGWFDDLHVYDTESGTWSTPDTKGPTPRARDKLASAVIGSNIYIFGGFGPQGPEHEIEEEEEEVEDEDWEEEQEELGQDAATFGWFNDLFIFDTVTSTWSNPMQMNLGVPTPRAAHGMCAIDKYLIIFGGKDSESRRNDLHIFDTETRKWEVELEKVINGRQPEPRSFHTATAVGHRVVIFGGRGTENQHFNDIHIFDTRTREWLQPAMEGDVPEARGTHTATVVGDKFLVFGGSSDYSAETMVCHTFYNTTNSIKTDVLLSGEAKPYKPPLVRETPAEAAAASSGSGEGDGPASDTREESSRKHDLSSEEGTDTAPTKKTKLDEDNESRS